MLNDNQRSMMEHALGYRRGKKRGDRNHYALGPGGDGWDDWRDLVTKGLATDRGTTSWLDGMHIFSVTEAGKAELTNPSKGED